MSWVKNRRDIRSSESIALSCAYCALNGGGGSEQDTDVVYRDVIYHFAQLDQENQVMIVSLRVMQMKKSN